MARRLNFNTGHVVDPTKSLQHSLDSVGELMAQREDRAHALDVEAYRKQLTADELAHRDKIEAYNRKVQQQAITTNQERYNKNQSRLDEQFAYRKEIDTGNLALQGYRINKQEARADKIAERNAIIQTRKDKAYKVKQAEIERLKAQQGFRFDQGALAKFTNPRVKYQVAVKQAMDFGKFTQAEAIDLAYKYTGQRAATKVAGKTSNRTTGSNGFVNKSNSYKTKDKYVNATAKVLTDVMKQYEGTGDDKKTLKPDQKKILSDYVAKATKQGIPSEVIRANMIQGLGQTDGFWGGGDFKFTPPKTDKSYIGMINFGDSQRSDMNVGISGQTKVVGTTPTTGGSKLTTEGRRTEGNIKKEVIHTINDFVPTKDKSLKNLIKTDLPGYQKWIQSIPEKERTSYLNSLSDNDVKFAAEMAQKDTQGGRVEDLLTTVGQAGRLVGEGVFELGDAIVSGVSYGYDRLNSSPTEQQKEFTEYLSDATKTQARDRNKQWEIREYFNNYTSDRFPVKHQPINRHGVVGPNPFLHY